MTLYYVQADDGNGDSLDLFIRVEDGGTYNSTEVLKLWRDAFSREPDGTIDTEGGIQDDEFPTRVFKVSDSCIGALEWHDPKGCDCVEDFDV